MTWIIGRAGPFGHAIGLSDIRVTLVNGRELDCLQKVHLIGPHLVLGFAGSVRIGLDIVTQLSKVLFSPDKTGIWDPLYIANNISVGTRELFSKSPDEEKALGCSLILFSVHPTKNDGAAPWAKCYVHRFFSPEFQLVEAPQTDIVSIGSGSGVKQYLNVLSSLNQNMDIYQLELGMPGGSGLGFMSSISSVLDQIHTPGISHFLQIILVGRDNVRIGNNWSLINKNLSTNSIMPNIAKNMGELRNILRQKGISSIERASC